MKKYLPIGSILVVFFILVIARFLFLHEDQKSPVTKPSIDPSSQNVSTPISASSGVYKDGTYTGDTTDAVYGPMQVQVTIQSGKISDIQFLQYPDDNPTTLSINQQAMPILKSEAIQSQSANVDVVSTASQSSTAFNESLASALAKAQ
jgi:uncharacterized protein with FMN-binding domain